MVLELPLSQGKIAIFDEDDYDLVCGFKWYAKLNRRVWYVATNTRNEYSNRTTTTYMHILIAGIKLVDHINGNGLDNRRANLRSVTIQENAINRRIRSDNTSGYKGVNLYKPNGKYIARIQLGNKRVSLGYYNTALEAALAYDQACRKYHGKFATLNFPDVGEHGVARRQL